MKIVKYYSHFYYDNYYTKLWPIYFRIDMLSKYKVQREVQEKINSWAIVDMIKDSRYYNEEESDA